MQEVHLIGNTVLYLKIVIVLMIHKACAFWTYECDSSVALLLALLFEEILPDIFA